MSPSSLSFNNSRLQEIQAKCLEESKRSMRILSQMSGLETWQIQQNVRNDIHYMILSVAIIHGGENYQEYVDNYYEAIKGMDFWQIIEYNHIHYNEGAYAALEHIFDKNLINQEYILELGKEIGMKTSEYQSFNHFVRDFAKVLPHIYMYEYEFKAFLKGRSLVDGFPALILYQTIFGVFQNIATIIVRNLFQALEVGGNFRVSTITDIELQNVLNTNTVTGRSVMTKIGLQYNIDALIGKNHLVAIDFTEKKGVDIVVNVVHDLINKFVVLHEYGHLFRGHLVTDAEPITLEYDADFFAIVALSEYAIEKKIPAYIYNLSIAIFFLCLHIRDVYFNETSKVHPLAIDRFSYLVSLIDNLDQSNSSVIFWNKIYLFLSKFLKETYNIQIMYLHERPAN